MNLIVLAESKSEARTLNDFLNRWIARHSKTNVRVKVFQFSGSGNLLRNLKSRADDYFRAPNGDQIIAVIALVDLYGLEGIPADRNSVQERVDWVRQHY